MDGYVKNKKEAIFAARKGILWKYAVTFPIILFLAVWLFGIYTLGSPDGWKSTEIIYAHISNEQVGLRRGRTDVLNTKGGQKYVIPAKIISADELKEALVPGGAYTLVYAKTIAGGSQMKALYSPEQQFLNRSDSVAAWKKQRDGCFLALYVTIGLELAALIFIDRLWCREEHTQIGKLRQDIRNRTVKTDSEKQ